jgi:glycosyltransferase involved in cell wall biosynthesis
VAVFTVSSAPGAGTPISPVRLLLVVDSLEVGGAERHVVDLAVALAREGYEATVACSIAGELSEPLEEANVPVRPLLDKLVKRRVSVAFARELRRLIKEERFDLVHAHIYASAAAAAIATLGLGVPLVITEHTEALWQGRRERWTSRRIYRRAQHIIAVSSAIRQRLIERDAVPQERITVIHNAVIPAPDAPPSALPDDLREGPLVGVVARLQPEKGVADFLKAAARVSAAFPEARFLVAGDGPLREELFALAEHLGVGERVRFLGYRADARALIGLLDVLVVPSLTEGAPLIVLEAMAAGIPVVASAVGGIPDQIRHDKEGLLVPAGDPAALGDALLELLQDPARARSLGEAGRLRADSEVSHATMVRRIEAVYRAALGRPPLVPDATREEPELRTTP